MFKFYILLFFPFRILSVLNHTFIWIWSIYLYKHWSIYINLSTYKCYIFFYLVFQQCQGSITWMKCWDQSRKMFISILAGLGSSASAAIKTQILTRLSALKLFLKEGLSNLSKILISIRILKLYKVDYSEDYMRLTRGCRALIIRLWEKYEWNSN